MSPVMTHKKEDRELINKIIECFEHRGILAFVDSFLLASSLSFLILLSPNLLFMGTVHELHTAPRTP